MPSETPKGETLSNDFMALALREFVQECESHFADTESALLQLEVTPDALHHIDTIFRNFHTVKGSAGLFEFKVLEDFCHCAETALEDYRTGSKVLDSAMGSLFLQINDQIWRMVQQYGAGQTPTPAEQDSIGSLTRQLKQPMAQTQDLTPEPLPATDQGRATHALAPVFASTQQLRIDAAKLDRLISLIGELSMEHCSALARGRLYADSRLNGMHDRITELAADIRDASLEMRMVPIGDTLARFRRVVRDLGADLGKEVVLEIRGGSTELDKTLVEKIFDPLMHMVRNALDHGIETPEQRRAAFKPDKGLLTLEAWHDSGNVVICIEDDGRGINRARVLAKAIAMGLVRPDQQMNDQAILSLIFAPGFSTATEITNISGRGVGMDAVKSGIEALRGSIHVSSEPGKGTRMDVRLPLTLASFEGFMVRIADTYFVLAMDQVVQVVESSTGTSSEQPATGSIELDGVAMPVIYLRRLYRLQGEVPTRSSVVVVAHEGHQFGIEVDQLLGPHQTVIKPLGRLFNTLRGVSGFTLLADGTVALTLHLGTLFDYVRRDV